MRKQDQIVVNPSVIFTKKESTMWVRKSELLLAYFIFSYGSVLQAYATQRFFKKPGFSPYIIDYVPKDEEIQNRYRIWAKERGALKGFILFSTFFERLFTEGQFNKFRKRLLTLTKRVSSVSEMQNAGFDFDLYCTGSDQVWGKIGTQAFDPAYF